MSKSILDTDVVAYEMAIRGLSQRKLAKLAGLSHITVNRALNGHRPYHSTLDKMTAALFAAPVDPAKERVLAKP